MVGQTDAYLNIQGYFHHCLSVAKNIQKAADAAEFRRPQIEISEVRAGEVPLLVLFDQLVNEPALVSSSRKLFADGHYTKAVEEAFKRLKNEVKTLSGLMDAEGVGLMQSALSPKKPLLKLNKLKSTSEKDEQRGYMDLFSGAMTAIRNPRAHEHDIEDEPRVALELLIFANHLMGKLENVDSSADAE